MPPCDGSIGAGTDELSRCLAPPATESDSRSKSGMGRLNPIPHRLGSRAVSFWHHGRVRRCRVCELRPPDRETIEAFVARGGSLRRAALYLAPAKAWGISFSAIGRHHRNHVRARPGAEQPPFPNPVLPTSAASVPASASQAASSSGPATYDAYGNYLQLLSMFGNDPAVMAQGMGWCPPRR